LVVFASRTESPTRITFPRIRVFIRTWRRNSRKTASKKDASGRHRRRLDTAESTSADLCIACCARRRLYRRYQVSCYEQATVVDLFALCIICGFALSRISYTGRFIRSISEKRFLLWEFWAIVSVATRSSARTRRLCCNLNQLPDVADWEVSSRLRNAEPVCAQL